MKSHPIDRIEQALCLWEDECFVLQISNNMGGSFTGRALFPNVGLVKNYTNFRKQAMQAQNVPYDRAWYRAPEVGGKESLMEWLEIYPAMVYEWLHVGCRTFHVSAAAQETLAAVDLEDYYWHDLAFPFETFVITLEKPKRNGKIGYDCVLVSKSSVIGPEGTVIHVMGLDSNLATWLRFNRKVLSKLAKRGKADRFIQEASYQIKEFPIYEICFHLTPEDLESKITSHVVDLVNRRLAGSGKAEATDDDKDWDMLARLVAQVCIPLVLLPEGSLDDAWETRGPAVEDSFSIAARALICNVEC